MRDWGDKETFRDRLQRFLDRVFPERQIHLRTRGRISFFRVPQWAQLTTTSLVIVFTGWVGYSTFSYIQHDEIIGAKNSMITDARQAYDDLLSDVTAYQRRFVELTRELEDNHNLMLSLVERNATLQRSLSTVEKRLENTESERENVAGAREVLRDKLGRLENDMRSLSTKNFSLRDNLMTVETDLQTVVRERDEAHHHNTELQSQVAILEDRLNGLQTAQDTAVEKMTERTMAYIGSLEKVVEIAGIEVDSLLASSDEIVGKVAQGGPFIPIKPEEAGGHLMKKLTRLDDHLGQWETLQAVMARLPLAAPLNTYYVTSSFGKRRDPMNKRWSAHYGVDFGGPMRSPVYAPASGVVKQAGTKGRYGRFIEIDHGSGILTRYGHLNKIMVKRGDKIDFRQKIAELGSSGRSTGPHLHYEIVFNGKPKDPMRFIKAGRHVFQKQ
ncbi:peptidoglycan DD-metalloendopeptidase family protein [Thalassospiraceae bacterium LMO-JJ14]|nr:peptidoglycan DD-metalloendopeptidase family protein [Thalassospiraceae bacterium LMO-JJ14]